MTDLHVQVSAWVDGGPVFARDENTTVPPAYTPADTRALTIRTVEDTAFALNREAFGRSASLSALIAGAARLRALEAIKDAMDPSPLRDQIEAIFDLTNDEVTAQFGDDPDGP